MPAERSDPAHAGGYHNVAADVSRLKLSNFARLFAARRRIMIRLTPDATGKGELDAAMLPGGRPTFFVARPWFFNVV